MVDSWRFRPPPPVTRSNICPVCATSHFPFCPPPPAFPYLAAATVDHHRRFPPPRLSDLNPHPYPGLPFIHQTPSKEYVEGREQTFPQRHLLKDEPAVVDACHLFREPHRASRPDHIVVIL